ncbi:ABC transporter substrate-binding protein [Acidithiobacillus ferrianus]|uniref:ABC transporter substrate-binding protein n=2 Tax=Acidithiobacillus ferrianus TaxID=2678518 RepID=A0ACD5H688_9PROT
MKAAISLFFGETRMKKLKSLLLAGTLTLAPFILSANADAEPITLGLSNWPGWVAWYVAEHNGYLKKYHADFKLVWFSSYMTSVEALSAGKIDANCQALIDTLAPVEKGVPIKVILVTDNSHGNDALMVNNSITTFKQLEGKTIAVRMDSIEQYLDEYALEKNNIPITSVHFKNMSTGDSAAALMAGRVDAAGVWNPWIQRIEEKKLGHAIFSSASAPGVIPDVVAARESVLKAYPQQFINLSKAWFATVKFIKEHPKQAAAIMAPHVELSPSVYLTALSGTRLFGPRLNLEAMNPEDKEKSVSLYKSTDDTSVFLKKVGAISAKPNPTSFLDSGFIEKSENK